MEGVVGTVVQSISYTRGLFLCLEEKLRHLSKQAEGGYNGRDFFIKSKEMRRTLSQEVTCG